MIKRSATFLFILFSLSIFAQSSSPEFTAIIEKGLVKYNLQEDDVANLIITDNYTSLGINHVYFKQSIDGIEIFNSYGAVHGKPESLYFQGQNLLANIDQFVLDRRSPASMEELLVRIASQKSYEYKNDLQVISQEPLANQKAKYESKSLSQSVIQSRLVYYLKGKNDLKLARIITIDEPHSPDYFEFLVDANSGEIIQEYNYTVYCDLGGSEHEAHDHSTHKHTKHIKTLDKSLEGRKSTVENNIVAPNQYRVYEQPVESPLYGGQTDVTAPWLLNTTASPNGWHNYNGTDFTHTRGNNVDSYLDDNNSNTPTGGDAARADGGANLEFLYDVDTAGDPADFQEGALVNLFYWNNIIHDVWFNYGFDEASGNFQEENYTSSGNGGDYVQAEGQDGGGTCNANMSTPGDGGNPRMQMYLCNGRDGDLDNGVVVHEYVHGISNRLTGGPAAAGCLGNLEQMGEGWSDYYGIVMTIEPGDTSTDLRPIGNWLVGQNANGGGIRSFPYTTDMSVNTFTYDDIKTESVPHGVGSVWCTMLWDMTWALIEEYGYDPDIYNGTGGNNIAMFLVTEGMKQQPCSPGFIDGRDGILAADMALYGGANQCLIWEVFARRGLGFSASQGSSGSRSDGTEAFDMPGFCVVSLDKTASVSEAAPGADITYTIKATNNTASTKTGLILSDPLPDNTLFQNASNGGSLQGNTVVFPAFDLGVNQEIIRTFTVQVDPNVSGEVSDFLDDMENGEAQWNTSNTGASSFGLSTSQSNSGASSWFAADVTSTSIANLVTATTLYISNTSTLTFTHNYDTEVTWDGGVVEISLDNGGSWTDLGPYFTANGYNSTINNSRPAFSGNSNGFITSTVDLSDFVGAALIRFQMNCDQAVGGVGWYIDDVLVDNQQLSIPNTAQVVDGSDTYFGVLETATLVLIDPTILSITTNTEDVLCNGRPEGKAWVTATSGTGSYTYSWSNGATIDTISNLTAGLYTVTVNDGISTKVASAQVNEPAVLSLDLTSTDAPQGTGGSATVTPMGGTALYSYLWSNGGTTQTITNLNAGNYIVTTTDANSCTEVGNVDVIDPTNCTDNLIVLEIMMDQWPEDINVYVRDGSGTVVFEKLYDNSTPDGALVTEYICVVDDCYEIEIDDEFGDGLCENGNIAGFYKITDGATNRLLFEGCDIGTGVFHDLCYPLLTYSYTKMEPSCSGLLDGEIDLTLMGGNPVTSVTYSNGATTEDVTGLAAGEYIVSISDSVTTYIDTIFLFESLGSVYLNNGNDVGSLYYAAVNVCATDTIKFEDVLMNDVVVVDQEVPLKNGQIVNGLGINMVTVSGDNMHRIFTVEPGATVKIFKMTLQDGFAATNGGAIHNEGKLTLEAVEFKNNFEGSTKKSLTNDGFLIIEGNVIIQE